MHSVTLAYAGDASRSACAEETVNATGLRRFYW